MTEMIPWTTGDFLEATGGNLLCGDMERTFSSISIDSRNISTGSMFVAIKGDTHDGHFFLNDVADKESSGVLICTKTVDSFSFNEFEKKGIVCISVPNTIKALGDLAAFQRRRADVSVVAVTGSNGKTSTRQMVSTVVEQKYAVLSTAGNFNNEIGLPLTLFRLKNFHKWAVLELGMNHFGEISRLSEICKPDIGIITNIGPAHLEGVGSIEGVMKAKGELLEKIKPGGTVVLNADDPKTLHLVEKAPVKVLLYGTNEKANVRGVSLKKNNFGTSFTLKLPIGNVSVDLTVPGQFMVMNALAAASVGYLAGLTPEEIKKGLELFQPVEGRMNTFRTGRGINIIDDTYNANPGSMKAALDTLLSLKGNNRGFFVAGDMYELGDQAESFHKEVGENVSYSNIEKLYAAGKFAETVAQGALDENMKPGNIFTGTKEEILEDIKKCSLPGDWILVKGSRAMGMEIIVEGLKLWAG